MSPFSAAFFPISLTTHCSDYDHAVVIIHTHSADETGDLWFTSCDEKEKGPAATPIGSVCILSVFLLTSHNLTFLQFIDAIFGEDMTEYLSNLKFSAFFLLACGAVVKEGEALTGLQSAAEKYVQLTGMFLSDKSNRLSFVDTFAFGAERLISHHVAIWMISYAGQVIIGGQPSNDCISNLLYSSHIGKHTSVVYINRNDDSGGQMFTCNQYIWEHKSMRPNSFSFPLACSLCHHIYSWRIVPTKDGAPFKLMCTTKIEGKKCTGTWEVPALPSTSEVSSPYVGTWRKM